ncbi:MAG: signal peptidase I [Actinobacteria bacterium HGW-Actinobacteria-4]|nr:MAG: signal peptidase I [Actinobacteria bacterium HGW-Actinobacteria-4]
MKHRAPGTDAPRVRRYLGVAGSVLIWIIVAIDAWFLWPTSLGGDTSLVIVSGSSMEPTYFAGDLVIARKMEPSVGDVIVYAPTDLGGSQVVHRIIGGDAESGWELQGDNNDFIDPFYPVEDEVRGVVVVHYTNLGRLSALLLSPIVWACVLVVSIALLLWFSDDCEDEDEDGEDGGECEPADDEPDAHQEALEREDSHQSPVRESVGAPAGASS